MFRKVLVANRGAVAARVIRALREMGIASVVVYSDVDRDLPYVAQANEAYALGDPAPQHSYLNQSLLLDVLRRSGADALHPGYGFLSENAAFAREVEAMGVCFVGPSPRWIDVMGHKVKARDLMAAQGMPMCPSSGLIDAEWDALPTAARDQIVRLGYPLLVKPANGGGGIGMLPARNEQELLRALAQARSLATRSFGSAEVYVERLVERPRHIEFQILADRAGHVRVLYERDCSVQRRHQKVIEEAPAPSLSRALLDETATRIAAILGALKYDVIGTVEMLYDPQAGAFHFLEMNTRLQVEHAVTEAITGVDIVAAQLRLAAGEAIDAVLPPVIDRTGHAIEARLYAEDPVRFFPSPGPLDVFRMPGGEGIRVETGYGPGARVTPFYDPMLAKIVAHAPTRALAIERLAAALRATEVCGVKTNIPFIQNVLASPAFVGGGIHTGIAAQILAG